jgi:hypothetical protein
MSFSKSAGSFEMIVLGRFSIGLACGFFTGLVPLYVSEIAPVKIRGELGTVNQLAVTTGILVSQVRVNTYTLIQKKHTKFSPSSDTKHRPLTNALRNDYDKIFGNF